MTIPSPEEISAAEAAALREGDAAVFLDVRTPMELNQASIDGAVVIEMRELPERISEVAGLIDNGGVEPARPMVVFCHGGVRSLQVVRWLRSQDAERFANAWSMAGGIDVWSLEVDPSVPRY